VNNKQPTSSSGIIVKGKHVSDAGFGLKAVPRQIHAFISRLAKETTEADLVDWLQCVGINNVEC